MCYRILSSQQDSYHRCLRSCGFLSEILDVSQVECQVGCWHSFRRGKRWRRLLGPLLRFHSISPHLPGSCRILPSQLHGLRWCYNITIQGWLKWALYEWSNGEALIHDWMRFLVANLLCSYPLSVNSPLAFCKWLQVTYWFSKLDSVGMVLLFFWYKEGVDVYFHLLRQRVCATVWNTVLENILLTCFPNTILVCRAQMKHEYR